MKTYRNIVARSIVAGLIALGVTGAAAASTDTKQVLAIDKPYRLDLLPKLRQFESVGCVSSYDPTGGNDDGFSGKHSFIRKEEGGLVIAELEGPGVITRFHMSQPTNGVIKFYFDGEASPRIQVRLHELFSGAHAPFLPPLVGIRRSWAIADSRARLAKTVVCPHDGERMTEMCGGRRRPGSFSIHHLTQ